MPRWRAKNPGRPADPYDLGHGAKQPKFFLSEEGQRAAAEHGEWLEKHAEWQIDRSLDEVLFDARHLALRRAKAADSGDPLPAPGWDYESVAFVMQLRSAERVGSALTRATIVLAAATVALVMATIALVLVTITGG